MIKEDDRKVYMKGARHLRPKSPIKRAHSQLRNHDPANETEKQNINHHAYQNNI